MPIYYEIEFSKRAEEDYDRIVKYLIDNWGESAAKQFILDINEELARIKAFPSAFPSSCQRKEVRRCVMSKINTIYYIVEKRKIYIITIFDNRQENVTI